MALTFAKKGAAAAKPAPKEEEAPTTTQAPATKSTTKLPWMKKGAEAKQAIANEDAKAELAKQEKGKLWRFWMPPESERQVTFLDGEVDEDGMLDIPMFYEHSVMINGNRENFICTSEQEGFCPICDKGDSKAYLVGVMTVVDHTPHKIKSGQNAGKTIQNTRKLFVAKKETIKQLSKIAVKRGGLTGATFDVTRGNDRTAAVGNQFDFVSKDTLAKVAAKYGIDQKEMVAADYGQELTYRTADELVQLGIGKAPGGVGYEKGAGTGKNLKDEL